MRFHRFAVVSLVVGLIGLLPATVAQAAPAPTITGVACGPNEGVTVVVDFAPSTDGVTVGCAAGAQDSILTALTEAGFTVDARPFAGLGNYLCGIDGVVANAADCFAFPGNYWSSWLNTNGGNLDGAFTQDWASAQAGVDGGPLAVGTVVGFVQSTTGSNTPALALTDLPQPDNTEIPVPAYGPANGSATAAAGWIGRQLAAGNGLINGSVGLTVDSIYTLAAAGVGGDQIAQSAAAVFASGTAYIGDATAIPEKFAQISKVALALQIAGLDATAFPDGAGGTRDLLADIRSVLNPDGSFGSYDDPFLHAYALLALSRTAGGVPSNAVRWLEDQQCDDSTASGSFGYAGCDTADPDYTALAVQGLLAAGIDAGDSTVASAVFWLSAQQIANGVVASADANTNTSGLAGSVFAAVGEVGAAEVTAGFIGGLQVTCDSVLADGSALVDDNVGAIAWKPASLTDATSFGIDDGNLGEWQYATAQAVLGLGTPALNQLTAEGADAALPAAAVCAPPTTSTSETTPSAPDSVSVTPTSSASVIVTTSTTPTTTGKTSTLASTGVNDRTVTELSFALVLLIAGGALVVATRRRGAVRKH